MNNSFRYKMIGLKFSLGQPLTLPRVKLLVLIYALHLFLFFAKQIVCKFRFHSKTIKIIIFVITILIRSFSLILINKILRIKK